MLGTVDCGGGRVIQTRDIQIDLQLLGHSADVRQPVPDSYRSDTQNIIGQHLRG